MNPSESGIALRFHLSEGRRHHGRLLWEWLLELARELDLPGGTAYRALAGYGRHRRLHEAHFFELAGDAPIDVIFILRPADEARLLERIRRPSEISRMRFALLGAEPPAQGRLSELRAISLLLPADDAALLAYARALTHWHHGHRFCGRCGGARRRRPHRRL